MNGSQLMEKRMMVSTLRVTLDDRHAEAAEIKDLIARTNQQLSSSTKQVLTLCDPRYHITSSLCI
jgi:hypothetical protein